MRSPAPPKPRAAPLAQMATIPASSHQRSTAHAWSTQLQAVDGLAALADCDLVVEAIVERLDAKQALFAELETCAGPGGAGHQHLLAVGHRAGRGLQRPSALPGCTSSTLCR
jgi:3-hydroxybutyryl-CoA dehydrogenase